jgi:hypothetical protein
VDDCCSDIDDTMLAALFDTRYPELTVYPGVHQFAQELLQRSATLAADTADRHSGYEREDSVEDDDLEAGQAAGAKRAKSVQRVAFLTARPEFLRKRSLQELRACGFQHFTRKYSHVGWGEGQSNLLVLIRSLDGPLCQHVGLAAHRVRKAAGGSPRMQLVPLA